MKKRIKVSGAILAALALTATAVFLPSTAFAAEEVVDPATTVVAEQPVVDPASNPDAAAGQDAQASDTAGAEGGADSTADGSAVEDASTSETVTDEAIVVDTTASDAAAAEEAARAAADAAAAEQAAQAAADAAAAEAAATVQPSTPATIAPQATAPQPVETVLTIDIICVESSPVVKVTTQSVVPEGQPLAHVTGTVVNDGFHPFEGDADASGYFQYTQPVVVGEVDTIVNVNGSYAGDELNIVTEQTCAPEVKTIEASGVVRKSDTTDSEITFNTAVYDAQECVEYYDLATDTAISSGFAFTADSSFGARSTCGEFVIVTGGPWPFEYVEFSKIVQGATTTEVNCESDPKTAVDSYLETEWVREAIKGEVTDFKPGTTKVISNERPATAAELAAECDVVIPPGEDPDDHEPPTIPPVIPPVTTPGTTPVVLLPSTSVGSTWVAPAASLPNELAATGNPDPYALLRVQIAAVAGTLLLALGLVLLSGRFFRRWQATRG